MAIANELKLDFAENCEAVRWAFDLSQNTSLQMLETTARSINCAGDAASGFLKSVLSTVTSALPLDLVINYDVYGVPCHMRSYIGRAPPSDRAGEALVHLGLFKVFNEIYMVWDFRLVLCADVLDRNAQDARRALECIVREGMNGGLEYLSCEPLIISEKRSHNTRDTDSPVGAAAARALVTCAL